MASRAKRYDEGQKLNVKKVVAVILGFLLIIAIILGIIKTLDGNSKSVDGKIENVCYYTIYDDGRWGVIDSYGDVVIDANYDEMIVIPDKNKDIFICTYDVDYTNGTYKTKVLNSKKKEIIKDYDKIEPIANYDESQNIWYEEDVFRVEKSGKYGLVNYSGKELLKCDFDSIEALKGVKNSLIIKQEEDSGLCDNSGNIIIDPIYSKIEKIGNDYKNGYIVVDNDGKYGIVGFDKSSVLEIKYDGIKNVISDNVYAVKENNEYVIVNKSGERILDKTFADILELNKDYIVASTDGSKYGVIDMQGDTKIDFKYDELHFTSNNNYIAKNEDKYGIVSIDGGEKLGLESSKIEYVKSGDFIVADYLENGATISKIYDSNYQEKISGNIDEINNTKGYIRILTNGEYKYYNFKFEEKNASQLLTSNTLFLSQKDEKYGFVNKNGDVVVDYIYDNATEQNSDGYAGISQNGLWGSIDLNGNVIVEPKYKLDNNKKIDFIGKWHLCEDYNANYYLDE